MNYALALSVSLLFLAAIPAFILYSHILRMRDFSQTIAHIKSRPVRRITLVDVDEETWQRRRQ